jgi:hypothetical protein
MCGTCHNKPVLVAVGAGFGGSLKNRWFVKKMHFRAAPGPMTCHGQSF